MELRLVQQILNRYRDGATHVEAQLSVEARAPAALANLPELSPPGLSLEAEARAVLAELRSQPLSSTRWLELAEHARQAAIATFAPERQHNALVHYLENCREKPAVLIAAHTIALTVWARRRRAVTIGLCHDAACRACGLHPSSILFGRPLGPSYPQGRRIARLGTHP